MLKIAVVLCGSHEEITKQISNLCSFIKQNISQPIDVEAWILSSDDFNAQQELTCSINISAVRYLKIADDILLSNSLLALQHCFAKYNKDLLIFAASDTAKQLTTRVATLLTGSSATNICSIVHEDQQNNHITCQRKDNNKIMANINLTRRPFCLSISANMIDKDANIKASNYEYLDLSVNKTIDNISYYCRVDINRNNDISNAKTVLIIGQGVAAKANVEELTKIAQQYNIETGVTRAVALNGWAPMQKIIGSSGSVISPSLCICVGVSGASPLFYGIKDSDYIIAINNDANAPIMSNVDTAIVNDWSIVKKLLAELYS